MTEEDIERWRTELKYALWPNPLMDLSAIDELCDLAITGLVKKSVDSWFK